MKNLFITLVGVIFMASACQHSSSKEEARVAKNNALTQDVFVPEENGYKLIWEDNFEGSELDTTKFQLRQTGARRIGYNDPSMVRVENGNLLLMYDIRKDSVLSGMIGTANTFMTTYGYFECRARMPKSVGPWAAFWFQSPQISDGEDPGKYGAEIDVFEYFKGLGNDTMTHCLHWAYGPNQQSSGQMTSYLEGLSAGFHTFGLEWTDTKYSFFIDGLKYHEQTVGLSHIDEYMILSMELPSTLEGIKKACAPDTFIVDYVRAYKR